MIANWQKKAIGQNMTNKSGNAMKIAGITYESLVDGPGIRVVVFAQGCDLACPHCHNPESWDTSAGKDYTVPQLFRAIKKPGPGRQRVRGVTFSGGEPFMQAEELAQVAVLAKRMSWDVVTYTGHTYEKLIARNSAGVQALLDATDYLIDGPYNHIQRDLDLRFRGSGNQRVIDMNATRQQGLIVLAEE